MIGGRGRVENPSMMPVVSHSCCNLSGARGGETLISGSGSPIAWVGRLHVYQFAPVLRSKLKHKDDYNLNAFEKRGTYKVVM